MLVFVFLGDTPRPLVSTDLLPGLISALTCNGGTDRVSSDHPSDGSKRDVLRGSGVLPRCPSKEWHFASLSEAPTSSPLAPDTETGDGSLHQSDRRSDAPTSGGASGSAAPVSRRGTGIPGVGLARRASDPHGIRRTAAAAAAATSMSGAGGHGLQEHALSPASEDDAIDALRECLSGLSTQALNVLARLCAHIFYVATQRAHTSRAGCSAEEVVCTLAEAFVYAVFRVGGASSTSAAPDAPTRAPLPHARVLVRLLSLFVPHCR